MATALDREDLIDGLRELVRRARAEGISGVSIRIVGGAALRLAYFDRPTTVDIDARIQPAGALVPLIAAIAVERNWPGDWLNTNASQFIPAWGASVEWRPLLDDASVSIWVASLEVLLAMKLHALQSRSGRDADDAAKLLRLNEIKDVTGAEEHYERFYPGDGFTTRTHDIIQRMFQLGLPAAETPPPLPSLSS